MVNFAVSVSAANNFNRSDRKNIILIPVDSIMWHSFCNSIIQTDISIKRENMPSDGDLKSNNLCY